MDSTSTASRQAVEEAADRLSTALATATPVPPVRDLIGADDVLAAYAVQQHLTRARLSGGAIAVGRKIGLTSPAVQAQLGVDRPDFGVLFSDMEIPADGDIRGARLLQPRVEAEVAVVLRHDLAEGDLELEQVREAVGEVAAAIEVCDSRVAGWDITFGDTVADNASAGAFVLSPERKTLEEVEPREVTMRMTVTGLEDSVGDGSACLGDPLLALQWLARQARELGDPLRAGEVVLTGALGPMRPIPPGSTATAHIDGLGSVTVHHSSEETA
ncbi:fumarylacetoacetate hydrolase family protein [Ornithinimicrobium humiphilum]|uniref:2-keto-4-pentenoate hydratase n=1 Tax=Ornithinimicrobium humiphilum TaxID=125288 RepID=UPI0031E31D84